MACLKETDIESYHLTVKHADHAIVYEESL